ncbi:amidohydrolase [Clostridium tetanomorphum]|uniref:M20 metallopeptidase family protein n=1 Tax=Clostridium tetanomorphum TaxID=1553 RepID=UPI00055517DF|nr:amidohydrolase [Clostridium tetanomorphum]NRS84912.1 amidohydrolase [Clostridium tetanomorphum]SQB91569.1 amidohydrolase [Clostridium tetanomorphum]
MKIDFLDKAYSLKEHLINWRRDFHMNPELGYEEKRTSSIVKDFLAKNNIEYRETATTGVCAIIKGKGKKTIAIRADMDALPLNDNKKCSYSSKIQGKMHACGHDAHTTILMGTALILNNIKENLNGNVKLFFEPAEETTGGAKIMIKDEVLENPYVDAVIGLHVDENIQCGKVAIKKGVVNAASNPFTIKIKGKGGHGAHPHTTVDPVFIAGSIIVNLQSIISRELPPVDPGVLTIGSINGGTAQNIIPEEVIISGIIRTMKKEQREYVKRRLKEIVEGVTNSLRGKCEIEIEESYPCLYNDDEMYDLFLHSSGNMIGNDNIIKLDTPNMGVESFAYFSMERPSLFYYLGVRNDEKGIINPAHGSLFDIDEDSLPIGVALQCQVAFDFLNK